MQLDDEICLCFHVTKRKILNYLRVHPLRVPSQLSACAGAGTGCGWCVPVLKRYFELSVSGDVIAETDSLSPESHALGRARHLRDGKGIAPPGATPPPLLETRSGPT